MAIEQLVDIPAGRRPDPRLDLPPEFPAGRAILVFTAEGDAAAVRGNVRDITPEETRLLVKQVIEEHRPAFIELAK
jgi:hypothetical protein